VAEKRAATWSFGGDARWSGRAQRKKAAHRRLAELGGRGRPHYHLVKLHDRLTELGGRRRPHRRLAKPSGRGQPHSRLTEPSLEEWQERNPTEKGDHTTI